AVTGYSTLLGPKGEACLSRGCCKCVEGSISWPGGCSQGSLGISKGDLSRTRRRFCREVIAWKALRHPNILPLLGVTMTRDQFVRESKYRHGSIKTFMFSI
ncbi:hypothetical protein BDM02DRAFT_578009, partial [Thelephora ganbajun]